MARAPLCRALLALALAGAPAAAGAIAFPGDTWGRVSHELDDNTGTGISFFVNQGVDWFELPGGITFNTYAEYRYAKRTTDRTYFDAQGEALGFALRRSPFIGGVEWFRERLPEQGNTTSDVTRAYFSWYYEWYQYKRKRLQEGGSSFFNFNALTGSTWGRVRHDLSDPRYTTVQFFVNEGIDWFDLPGEITFNTYAEVRVSYRNKDDDYYTTVGPAIGMELQRPPFRLGTDYFREYYTRLKVWDPTWRLYLTWYYNWDLKNLKFGGD